MISFKRAAKRFVMPTYRKVYGKLPRPMQESLLDVESYVRGQYSSRNLPYWERREADVEKPLVRLGFVGAGRYAQNHLKVLSQLRNVELSAMLTTGGPRAQGAAAEFGIGRLMTDPEAFFALPELDAFVVVVPPEFLKDLSLAGLRTGKPVLLEKPPGVTAADAAELVSTAAAHKTFGMVCMNRRFFSALDHGLAYLASRGPIKAVTIEIPQQVTLDRHLGRVSAFDYEHYFMRMSIHGVDLARYLLGEPLAVHSLAYQNREFQYASARFVSVLEFPGHVVATITEAWDSPAVWRLKMIAEEGWLELEPLERGFVARAAQGLHGGIHKVPIRTDPVDSEFRAGVYAQDLTFVEAVRAKQAPSLPACLLPDAHRTMVVMEKILGGTLTSAAS
jgi:predicted dehydrogenase